MSPAEREGALEVHARGLQQLDSGNVYAARKYFERGVEAGLPESAVALAATYDPASLPKLQVIGRDRTSRPPGHGMRRHVHSAHRKPLNGSGGWKRCADELVR